MTDLQTLAPNAHSTATAINSIGQVAGVSYDLGNLQPQAFLWENETLTSLGLFTPNAINDAGYVAGTRQTLQGGGIWRSEAVMRNDTSNNWAWHPWWRQQLSLTELTPMEKSWAYRNCQMQ